MRFALTELARAVRGELVVPEAGSTGGSVEGLATDSRQVHAGQLFAALRAERDGHEFVDAAVRAGAAAVLVERVEQHDVASIVVDDVGAALPALASMARDHLPERVIGVTGSVGKTTTKDQLASVLARRFVTAASERSFNNELGVPLTLCNAPDDVEAVVVEMGARGSGHIAFLCEMARPTVGIVTTVQAVHTEMMGGLEQIARTKGELIEALPDDGLAVLNAAVPLVEAMASRTSARVLSFGDGGEVHAVDVTVDDELRASFSLRSPWGALDVRLGARGVHNVDNALAAAAAALWLGVTPDEVAAGLEVSEMSPWRMDLRPAPSGALVLNDAYNASPASVTAALHSLVALPAQRRVAVLGLMGELGEDAPEHHRRIRSLADELGVELVVVDTDLYGVDPVDGIDGALAALDGLGDGDAVLVKASRVVGLERVAAGLLDG
ncbi:MAG: UDP-N-acetylmuramoyl-tripeptide--D-alanyl-D-alanine ligase [Microthrixaceae bacterium]